MALLSGLALLAAGRARASPQPGPWLQPKGGFDLRLWGEGELGGGAFLADGTLAGLPTTYFSVGAHYDFEYAVTDGLSLVVHGFPAAFAGAGGRQLGFTGPDSLGVRQAILDGPLVLTLELLYGFAIGVKVGDQTLAGGAIRGHPWNDAPVIGNQFGAGELQAGVVLPFGWAAASAGVVFNAASELDPVVRGRAEIGLELPLEFTAALGLSAASTVGRPVVVANLADLGAFQRLSATLVGSLWILPWLAVRAGVEPVVAGRGVGGGAPLWLELEIRSPIIF
jgi:hypothetical protein